MLCSAGAPSTALLVLWLSSALSSTSVDIPHAQPVIRGGSFSSAPSPVPSSLCHSLTLVGEQEILGAVDHLMLHFLACFFLFISLPFSSPHSREP